jgi:hypothetical protein
MFGDYPILKGVPSQITMKCESMTGSVWKISAKNLLGLKDNITKDDITAILARESDIF